MDKYVKVTKKRDDDVKENEIRITASGKIQAFISYATKLLEGEKPQDTIVLKAMGRAMYKAVTVAEFIKRKLENLHQITQIGASEIHDEWQPLEEGLRVVHTSRRVSFITITLSKNALDSSDHGYQAPGTSRLLSAVAASADQETKPRSKKPRKKNSKKKSNPASADSEKSDSKQEELLATGADTNPNPNPSSSRRGRRHPRRERRQDVSNSDENALNGNSGADAQPSGDRNRRFNRNHRRPRPAGNDTEAGHHGDSNETGGAEPRVSDSAHRGRGRGGRGRGRRGRGRGRGSGVGGSQTTPRDPIEGASTAQ